MNKPEITAITISTFNIEKMVHFYKSVFNVKFEDDNIINGLTIYKSVFGGITLYFCPNEIAKVKAKQNRHQLKFKVNDLRKTLKDVDKMDCEIINGMIKTHNTLIAAIADPDGNSIELVQYLNN